MVAQWESRWPVVSTKKSNPLRHEAKRRALCSADPNNVREGQEDGDSYPLTSSSDALHLEILILNEFLLRLGEMQF